MTTDRPQDNAHILSKEELDGGELSFTLRDPKTNDPLLSIIMHPMLENRQEVYDAILHLVLKSRE